MRRTSFRGDPFKALRFVARSTSANFLRQAGNFIARPEFVRPDRRCLSRHRITCNPWGAARSTNGIITAVDVMPSWDVSSYVYRAEMRVGTSMRSLHLYSSCKPHFSERSRYFHVYIAGSRGGV